MEGFSEEFTFYQRARRWEGGSYADMCVCVWGGHLGESPY